MADLAHLWLVAQGEGDGECQGSRTAAVEVLVPREGQALALPMPGSLCKPKPRLGKSQAISL